MATPMIEYFEGALMCLHWGLRGRNESRVREGTLNYHVRSRCGADGGSLGTGKGKVCARAVAGTWNA